MTPDERSPRRLTADGGVLVEDCGRIRGQRVTEERRRHQPTSFDALLRPAPIGKLTRHDELAASADRFWVGVLGGDEREHGCGRKGVS